MIKAVAEFIKILGKVTHRDVMILANNSTLNQGPKAFKRVNMSAVGGDVFLSVVDNAMFHERLNVCVAFVFVRMRDRVFDINMLTHKSSKLLGG
jgi:hypothetical protein